MTEYNQLKGNTYEEFVLNNLLNKYDAVYYFKETPEDIIAKTKLYSKYDIYQKYKNSDIGADLVAIKDDQVYFIQCKNFNQTISINDFCSFYFLVLEYELNGLVYYNRFIDSTLYVYTMKDGLSNDYVYGIARDSLNSIWVSTNRGISQLIDDSTMAHGKRIRNYSQFDGLSSSEFNFNAFTISKNLTTYLYCV